MMKRVIALLICLMLTLAAFTGCVGTPQGGTTGTGDAADNGNNNNTDPNKHTHTYETTWSSDANDHWYNPSCDCEDAPIVKLPHTDANNDGKCGFCLFVSCEHTYAEEWTVDCTNHWHAADCGHIVPGTAVEKHSDENKDGKCDICTWVIEDIHEHLYDDEWTWDSSNHWYAPICEHADAEVEKLPHEINAAGYCSVCDAKLKEIDKTDINAMLEAAIALNNKVTGGKVNYVNTIFDTLSPISYYIENAVYDWGEVIWSDDIKMITFLNAGTYTLSLPANFGIWTVEGYQAYWETYIGAPEVDPFENIEGTEYVITVDAGETFAFHYAATENYAWGEIVVTDENGNAPIAAASIISEGVYFTLGENSSYINAVGNAIYDGYVGETIVDQSWYQLISPAYKDENDNMLEAVIFGVKTIDGTVTLERVAGTAEHLNGYTYNPSTLLGQVDDTSTLALTLKAIYDLSQTAGARSDLVEKVVEYDAETGIYTINFTYLEINEIQEDLTEYALYTVESQFTFDANGVINEATLNVVSYADLLQDVYSGEILADDFDYDAETDTVTLNEVIRPNIYSYVVSQNSGVRTYDSAYPKSAMVPVDFNLSFNGALVQGAITADVGTFVNLNLFEFAPATSSSAFIENDDIVVDVTCADATVDCTGTAFYADGTVTFFPKVAGEYTLTITYGTVVKVIFVTVEAVPADSLGLYEISYDADWEEYSVDEYCGIYDIINLFAGESFNFAAQVLPQYAAQDVIFSVTKNGDTIDAATVIATNSFGPIFAFIEMLDSYEGYTFNATEAGEYVITAAAVENPEEIVATFTVVVTLPPQPGDILTETISYEVYEWDPTSFWSNWGGAYTAPVTGTYTFTVPTGIGMWIVPVAEIAQCDYTTNTDAAGFTFSIDLVKGAEVEFYFAAAEACTGEIALSILVGEEPFDPSTLEYTPVDADLSFSVLEELTYVTSDEWDEPVALTFTATEAGYYCFNVPTTCGIWVYEPEFYVDMYENWMSDGENAYVYLEADQAIEIYYGSTMATDGDFMYTITVSYAPAPAAE